MTGKVFIGTSGWVYGHWVKIFYPEDLPSSQRLKFFAKHFKTAEINYSFYHLPKPSTFEKWKNETPKDFVFAVKVSRFITHIQRLKDVKEPWETFLTNSLSLKEKLGPFLFQFPPSFKAGKEELERLKKFFKILKESQKKTKIKLRFAFEFRHKTWFEEKIKKIFEKNKMGWVIADSSRYPKKEWVTSDFAYLRFHGPKEMFASSYDKKTLKKVAQRIKKWKKEGIDVYVYFLSLIHI